MTTNAWFNFEHGVLHAPDGPLSQDACASIWEALPTTGCAWVAGGHLFVQARDADIAWDCGPVADGVTRPRK
jgi:hypothetical protein